MKTNIYYFSATGNSLAVAKKLKEELEGDVSLISITECVNRGEKIIIDCNKAGLIYPVYAYGSPRIVKDFLNLVFNVNTKYFFSIATSGGNPAGAMKLMNKRLKKVGIQLNAGFTVALEGPEGMEDLGIVKFMLKISGKNVRSWNQRKAEVINTINSSKDIKVEEQNFISSLLSVVFHPMSLYVFPSLDSQFYVNEKCKGCGICNKVCPVKNISMEDKKPKWNRNCEQCLGCMQWCPSKAIQNCEESINHEKYHHPDVKIKEIINENSFN